MFSLHKPIAVKKLRKKIAKYPKYMNFFYMQLSFSSQPQVARGRC